MPTLAHVSTKYQVVIPKEIRKKVNIAPRDELMVMLQGKDEIVFKKPITSFRALRGSFKFPKDYLKKERLSWE